MDQKQISYYKKLAAQRKEEQRITWPKIEKDIKQVIAGCFSDNDYLATLTEEGRETVINITGYALSSDLLNGLLPLLNRYKLLFHIKPINGGTKVLLQVFDGPTTISSEGTGSAGVQPGA